MTVKTLVHRHTELERDPICHIELSMTELSQTAVVFPCAAHHSRCNDSVEYYTIGYYIISYYYIIGCKKMETANFRQRRTLFLRELQ